MLLIWIAFYFLVSVECIVELHTHHHHTLHKRAELDSSSFSSPNAKNNEPVPSSGDGIPNSWLYRFPPWNTQHNPPPPNLKSTSRANSQTRETRFLARVLTPPNTEVKNDFLDDVSLSRHFPFQGTHNVDNGSFKRHALIDGNREATFAPSGFIRENSDAPHIKFTTEDAITTQFSRFRDRENEGRVLIPPSTHRGSLPLGPGSHLGLRGRVLNDQILALPPNSDPTLLVFEDANAQKLPLRNSDFGANGRDFLREPRFHHDVRPITNPFPSRAQRNVLELPVGLIAPGNIIQVPKFPPLPLEDHNYLSRSFSSQRNEGRDNKFDLQEQEQEENSQISLQSNPNFFVPSDAEPQPPNFFPDIREKPIPERRGNRASPVSLEHGNLPLPELPEQRVPKVSPRGLNPRANTRLSDAAHPSSIQDIINSQEVTTRFRRDRRKRRKPRRNLLDLGFWVWSRE